MMTPPIQVKVYHSNANDYDNDNEYFQAKKRSKHIDQDESSLHFKDRTCQAKAVAATGTALCASAALISGSMAPTCFVAAKSAPVSAAVAVFPARTTSPAAAALTYANAIQTMSRLLSPPGGGRVSHVPSRHDIKDVTAMLITPNKL